MSSDNMTNKYAGLATDENTPFISGCQSREAMKLRLREPSKRSDVPIVQLVGDLQPARYQPGLQRFKATEAKLMSWASIRLPLRW